MRQPSLSRPYSDTSHAFHAISSQLLSVVPTYIEMPFVHESSRTCLVVPHCIYTGYWVVLGAGCTMRQPTLYYTIPHYASIDHNILYMLYTLLYYTHRTIVPFITVCVFACTLSCAHSHTSLCLRRRGCLRAAEKLVRRVDAAEPSNRVSPAGSSGGGPAIVDRAFVHCV